MFENLSQLMQGWLSTPMRTGLVFWLGGLFLWIIDIIHWENFNKLLQGNSLGESIIIERWQAVLEFLRNMPETGILLLIVIILVIMALSGILVQFIQLKLLRLLEGYGWFAVLNDWRVKSYIKQFQKNLARWEELAKKANNLTLSEYREYVDLDKKIVLAPAEKYVMPTHLGNILRGYEQRPREKYGLDIIICWARLWLLLPKETQQELTYARAQLDEAVQLIIWGCLFFVWTLVTGWEAILVGMILILLGYSYALQAAHMYGQLIEATFDVYRHLLYEAVNWDIPKQNEKNQGEELTKYFWRGSES